LASFWDNVNFYSNFANTSSIQVENVTAANNSGKILWTSMPTKMHGPSVINFADNTSAEHKAVNANVRQPITKPMVSKQNTASETIGLVMGCLTLALTALCSALVLSAKLITDGPCIFVGIEVHKIFPELFAAVTFST
jgi:hypothetical protein